MSRRGLLDRTLDFAQVLVLTAVALLVIGEVGVRCAGVEASDDVFSVEGVRRKNVRLDPLLGPRPRPGFAGPWETGFEVVIDERGFRAAGAASADARAPRKSRRRPDACWA